MSCMSRYSTWLSSMYLTDEERKELIAIKGNAEEVESRFFAPLAFGTAGLRGIMGMGLSRMNRFVVAATTQALANIIIKNGEEAMAKGVAIAFDSRNNSQEFARVCACILAANNIRVYLFESLRPTPELSFAIRHFGAMAGINITASHNPKEYNGYKVYWSDGAQLPPAEADEIAAEILRMDIFTDVNTMDFHKALEMGKIRVLSDKVDNEYMESVLSMAINPDAVRAVADTFKIVFTPFHGAGYKLVPRALTALGYKHILCVEEQMTPDGNFPTVKSPNPENKEGFALAIELAKKNDVDLIIATDPDADRVGIVLRNSEGEYITLSGNQVGILLADYIIKSKKANGTLPENPAILKSIVSTKMVNEVCAVHGVDCYETFTGFKFMAEKIKELEDTKSGNYILAFEESYGYLCGDFARDKDAVTASMLIAEMAAYYKGQGKTLYDVMQELYQEYGFFAENTINIEMEGADGLRKMRQLMVELRRNPPMKFADNDVLAITDYQDGKTYDYVSNSSTHTEISGSNVLTFEVEDGTHIIVRPSGTEPKMKVYILAKGDTKEAADKKIEIYTEAAKALADE